MLTMKSVMTLANPQIYHYMSIFIGKLKWVIGVDICNMYNFSRGTPLMSLGIDDERRNSSR